MTAVVSKQHAIARIFVVLWHATRRGTIDMFIYIRGTYHARAQHVYQLWHQVFIG
jgi:hypothetical protein